MKHHLPTILSLIGILTLTVACSEASDERAPEPGAPPQAHAELEPQPAKSAPVDPEAWLLESRRSACLEPPSNLEGPVVARLRKAQKEAEMSAERAGLWVVVGERWIEVMRWSSDDFYTTRVEACIDVALEMDPKALGPRELRSAIYLTQHEFGEAARVARAVLAEDPERLSALGTLSDALLELGEYEEAVQVTERLADLRPGPAVSARVSYLSFLHGDRDQAKKSIRTTLMTGRSRLDPEPAAWAYCEAATLFWHEGDYSGADLVYLEALKWVADYPAALLGRGQVLLSMNKPLEAEPLLAKALANAPSARTAWLLAEARRQTGDADGATRAYAEVERLGADDRLTLALYLVSHKRDLARALELVEAERKVRTNIYVEDTYAWVLFHNGRIDDAHAASGRALRLGTDDARLLYHAGAIHIASGARALGIAKIEEALALNPEFDPVEADEARALLEGL